MKKFNIKAFFVDHGEKLGFGLGLLLLLGVLGGSEWFPYSKDPSEIITRADKAKQEIERNQWPEESRKAFTIRDYGQSIRDLRGPLATTGYTYSTPLWQPLYPPQQLAKDPKFLAVMELEAKAGTFILAVAPKVEVDPNAPETATQPATTVAAAEDDEFARPTTSAPNPFAGGGGAGFGAGAAAGHAGGASILNNTPTGMPTGMAAGHAGAPGMGGAMAEGMVGEYGMGAMTPGVTGRGERFISVRGVWPVLQQLQQYRSAMNLQSAQDARALLEIVDFVLERKTAIAGADPWAGEWQTIDISKAKEVLNECPDFDIDTFDPRLVDVTITMPLPKRLLGRWGDYATHPQIKDYQLKGPELERELKLQERLMREYEKMSARLPQKPKPRGGFAGTQTNFRGMADSIYSSAEGTNQFNTGMRSYMEQDPTMMGMAGTGSGGKLSPPDLKARLTAAERLFLFRYFDFDVLPGYAYRYRVKLMLRNPNYQRPLDQVIDKSVAEGETRETDWSTESTVAVVPESTNYFLKTVNRDPAHEGGRPGAKAVAYLKMFQWDRDVGTMIADTIQVLSIGQFLGEEKKKTWHLDVAKPSFREEEVSFQTDDLYLDGFGDLRVTADDHKDLKFPGDRKGLVGLSSMAVVMNDVGELKAIAPGLEADKEKQIQDRVDRERKAFESIKGKDPAAAPNPLEGGGYPGMLSGEGAAYPGMPNAGTGKKKGKAKPNPRKAGAMMSSGMMMAP